MALVTMLTPTLPILQTTFAHVRGHNEPIAIAHLPIRTGHKAQHTPKRTSQYQPYSAWLQQRKAEHDE